MSPVGSSGGEAERVARIVRAIVQPDILGEADRAEQDETPKTSATRPATSRWLSVRDEMAEAVVVFM